MQQIPKKIKAITIQNYGDPSSLAVKNISIPDIQEGYVLIRTEFSSIHPADEMIYTGKFPLKFPNDTLGTQGSGTVVKSGGGVLANSLMNQRVAFLRYCDQCTGAWAEYALINAIFVQPLIENVDFEQAASLFHAATVELMMKKLKKGNHRAVIQNAASGYIGKALIKYCNLNGIPTINIVKRGDQAEMLNGLGAEYIINSSEDGWKDRVKDLARSLKATICFDAVAGEMTGDLYELMPDPCVLYVYGFLSEQPCIINPMSFTTGKKLKGLSIRNWLSNMSVLKMRKEFEKIQMLWDRVFRINYCATVDLNGLKDALYSYRDRKTNSKILLRTRG